MDYQLFFMEKYHFIIVFYIIVICVMSTILVVRLFSKKVDLEMKIMEWLFWLCLVFANIYLVIIPIQKDKHMIDSNSFIQENGIVCERISSGGYRGIIKTIEIEVNGDRLKFYVLKAEEDFQVGEKVKVTYLPNSKCAVVERKK